MKISLPFFNRKRYIVLKAYTDNKRLCDYAPITRSSMLPPPEYLSHKNPVDKSFFKQEPTFRTCFAHVASLKTSAVVPAWSSFKISVDDDLKIQVHTSDVSNTLGRTVFDHNQDPYYDTKDFYVVKHVCNWFCEEDTGVKFVYAHHIKNNTNMRIPSGIVDYKHQHSMNIFNLVSKHTHAYDIPFKTPMVALYPMSDLPLYVESYHDPEKMHELGSSSEARFWDTGTALKLAKIKKLDNE